MVRDYFCLFFLASDIGVLVARLVLVVERWGLGRLTTVLVVESWRLGRFTTVLVVESSFSFAKEGFGVFSVVANGFWFAKEVLGQFSAFENGFWLAKEVSGCGLANVEVESCFSFATSVFRLKLGVESDFWLLTSTKLYLLHRKMTELSLSHFLNIY